MGGHLKCLQFLTPETIGRLGISFRRKEVWDRLGPHRFLKRRQSVFSLFIGSICIVIVVFISSLCWRRCLRWAKRCSLCLRLGFLLSSSSPLAMNFSRRSPEVFRLKIEDFQPLVVLVVLCHLNVKLLVIYRL